MMKSQRRQYLHEIEFFDHFTAPHFSAPPVDLLDNIHPSGGNPSGSIRSRLLDPRLQRIVTAAANGWVVERLR